MMASLIKQRTGFLPSQHGFRFKNKFAKVGIFELIGARFGPPASDGLCGGMVYAALDYYSGGMEIPPVDQLTGESEIIPDSKPLMDFVVRRLVSSFNILDFQNGAFNYYRLMKPGYPDAQAIDPGSEREPRSWAWTMVRQEWPVIRAKLDSGQPVPLGLVLVKLAKRFDVTEIRRAYPKNHQVLAYGYDLDGDDLKLYVYDPNVPGNDTVAYHLSIGDPERPVPVARTVDGSREGEVHCFFHTRYEYIAPPKREAPGGRILLFGSEDCTGPFQNVANRGAELSQPAASFVILGGEWSFYRQPDFSEPVLRRSRPLVLGPGEYRGGSVLELERGEILSLRAVA